METWKDLIVGTLEIAPELQVLVNLVGALFLLELASGIVALLGGVRR